MGEALEKYAKETCKVLVVANPTNTNCLKCSKIATKIPRRNFAALSRLNHNRATAQVANKLGVPVRAVSNVVVWGNDFHTQVSDASNVVVTLNGTKRSADIDEKWATSDLVQSVQQRSKTIADAINTSSAASAANAIKDCIRDWHFGTTPGEHVSLGVYSDGSYNIAKDIYYSFPVTCKNGTYSIVQNLRVCEEVKKLMKKSEEDLLAERQEAGLGK